MTKAVVAATKAAVVAVSNAIGQCGCDASFSCNAHDTLFELDLQIDRLVKEFRREIRRLEEELAAKAVQVYRGV